MRKNMNKKLLLTTKCRHMMEEELEDREFWEALGECFGLRLGWYEGRKVAGFYLQSEDGSLATAIEISAELRERLLVTLESARRDQKHGD